MCSRLSFLLVDLREGRGGGVPAHLLPSWVFLGKMPSLWEEQFPLYNVGITVVLTSQGAHSFIHSLTHSFTSYLPIAMTCQGLVWVQSLQ